MVRTQCKRIPVYAIVTKVAKSFSFTRYDPYLVNVTKEVHSRCESVGCCNGYVMSANTCVQGNKVFFAVNVIFILNFEIVLLSWNSHIYSIIDKINAPRTSCENLLFCSTKS